MQQTVGRYRIVRPLGRGAMGLVYLAEDPSLNRQVAIKMLDVGADSESDREFLRLRLLRDARAAAILSHPNIVAVFDIIEQGDSVYVVMEYIEGESLASFLDGSPICEPGFTAQVMRQSAAALDYTHSKGVVHRDIKPGNIMICPGGGVKILDFGIARMNDVRTSTPTGVIMGTVDYMAPEQVMAAATDGRADQFSLAAVAFRMMTGGTLFGRHALATLAYKLVNETPPPVRERNASLPAAVDPVVSRALARSPGDRYPTCGAFAEDLARALLGTITAATPTVSIIAATSAATPAPAAVLTAPVPAPSAKRTPIAAIMAGGALLAAGAAGIVIWHPWNQPADSTPVAAPQSPVQRAPSPAPEKTVPAETNAPPPPESQSAAHPPEAPPKPAPTKPRHTAPSPPKSAPVTSAKVDPPAPKTDAASSPPAPAGPQEQEPPFKRGQEQLRDRDYAAAIQSFSEAIRRHPKMAPAHFNLGFAYEMSNDAAKAIEEYSAAIRFGSQDPRVYANRGICEARLHQDDLALADFNKALELDPKYAGALNGRGAVQLRRHQYQPAIRDFTSAINSNPSLIVAYENRSAARRATGDDSGANDDLAAARRLRK